ncbi:MAG TPA: NfeD family protein [Trichocoleus sp.]|jgi:membrane protein implicated in regulation of membrane protease activity
MFQDPPITLLNQPVPARIEAIEGYTPRIKYRGTSWGFKLYGSEAPISFNHGQAVRIVGIQGISLLIQC